MRRPWSVAGAYQIHETQHIYYVKHDSSNILRGLISSIYFGKCSLIAVGTFSEIVQ
jgi:hypothetical protein